MSDVVVQPIYQNPIPIGTIAEAEAEGLSPQVYSTCAKPNPTTQTIGCPYYGTCMVSAKGVSGPKNYGIQIIKGQSQGGGMVTTLANCMWLAQKASQYESNGGSVSVIAEEGETIDRVTRIAVNNVTGDVAKKYDRDVHREDRRIKVLVEKWPRPGQNPELLSDLLRSEMAASDKERRRDENLARNLGHGDAVAPLDKRASRGHGGGKEKA